MEEIKKRDRPSLSSEGNDSDGNITSPVPTPKKRGRPSNPNKPKKSPSGRGRGRPPKNSTLAMAKKAANADVSDGDSAVEVVGGEVATAARGRPPKQGKLKLKHSIEATGKGRGRPKNPPKSDLGDDEGSGSGNEDKNISDVDEGGNSSDYQVGKKPSVARKTTTAKIAKRGRGRPSRVRNSDDDNDDGSDDKMDGVKERRPVGRPPSGGVKLNIVRTGRGQGRPKKAVAAKSASENIANGASSIPRKRGRPSLSGKGPYKPTGKPRGRPKASASTAAVAENPGSDCKEVDSDKETEDDTLYTEYKNVNLRDESENESLKISDEDDVHPRKLGVA